MTEKQRKMRAGNKGRRIHYHAGQKQPDKVTEVSCRQNEYFANVA